MNNVCAASALSEAHTAGVVHGSIRPDRIVRSNLGHFTLLGLGLPLPTVGELSTEPDLQKQPNRIAYMAPEQLTGKVSPAATLRPTAGRSTYTTSPSASWA